MGELVGAELVDSVVVETEILALEVEVAGVVEVELATQLQALLTLLATSPVQPATAYEGIAVVAVTAAVVKVAQND